MTGSTDRMPRGVRSVDFIRSSDPIGFFLRLTSGFFPDGPTRIRFFSPPLEKTIRPECIHEDKRTFTQPIIDLYYSLAAIL